MKYLEIQEDPKVEFGGCIIETKMGYVDASLTVKLETLSKAILAVHDDEKGH
jgi:flagellar biosynthesis/type III secretory pathway protein FliH